MPADKANLSITNAETGMKIDLGEACADVIAPQSLATVKRLLSRNRAYSR